MSGVRWSINVRDAGSGRLIIQEFPDAVLRTASIGKILLMTLSSGNATEPAALMVDLHAGFAAGEPVMTRVHGWQGRGFVAGGTGWGLDPLAHLLVERGLTVVNKTGTDTGVRAEVGVLAGPAAAIAYAVLANWDEGDDPAQRDAVLSRQRRLGLVIALAARGDQAADRSVPGW